MLQVSLDKTVSSVNTLNESLQLLMQQMSKEQNMDKIWEEISTEIEGLSMLLTAIKPVKRVILSVANGIGEYISAVKLAVPETGWVVAVFPKLSSMLINMGSVFKGIGEKILGMISKINLKVAAIVVIAVVAISAIIAIVKNWDKISSAVQTFVNETLPQVWGQLSQWVQKVSASVMAVLNQALNTTTELAVACWNQITSLWSGLCAWLQSAVFQPLTEGVTDFWEWIKQLLGSVTQPVSDVVYNLGVMFSGCWDVFTKAAELGIAAIQEGLAQFCGWIYANVAVPLGDLLSGVWNGFVNGAKAAWEGVKAVFAKVAEFFANTFRTAWQGIVNVFSVAGEIFTDIKDGVFAAFKAIVNSLITGINAVVKIPFDAINRALQTMRTVEIFSMTPFAGLRAITVPQIPYLAKGAVLPANQPFLAVVGDQKHGTNVEAPLATIQEAVALTMEELAQSNLAGHQATVAVLRQILEAVLGIRIGDAELYRAVERYREKRAVMYGTPL